jgi:hypothetical protein
MREAPERMVGHSQRCSSVSRRSACRHLPPKSCWVTRFTSPGVILDDRHSQSTLWAQASVPSLRPVPSAQADPTWTRGATSDRTLSLPILRLPLSKTCGLRLGQDTGQETCLCVATLNAAAEKNTSDGWASECRGLMGSGKAAAMSSRERARRVVSILRSLRRLIHFKRRRSGRCLSVENGMAKKSERCPTRGYGGEADHRSRRRHGLCSLS